MKNKIVWVEGLQAETPNASEKNQAGLSWQEGYSTLNKHSLQLQLAEKHLITHNTSNFEVDGLH